MFQLKNNSSNIDSFSESLFFSRKIAAMFIYVFITCLCFSIVIAEDTPVKIGNPLLSRFPTSGDPDNSRARSIWDMHYFNNRIYIGHGDYWANSGQTDVWIYNGTNFENEYTVDDEMIFDFFEFENKLFIPGNDATEDWSFENLYINDPNRVPNPGWIKLRTLPGGLHSFDVALFKDKLYASITTDGSTPAKALVSTDKGQTWTTFISEYCSFVVFDDFMFIVGENYYKYDGTTLDTVSINLQVSSMSMIRKVRFKDGVLYSKPIRYMLQNSPLYFLPSSEIKNDGLVENIVYFSTDNVRDIVVKNDSCYIMTAEEITQDEAYKGRIYLSSDLSNWSVVTEFTVPGIPLSFEMMNNKFYVGLGSRYESSLGWVCVGPESGSIWEIVPTSTSVLNNYDILRTEYRLLSNYPNPFNPTTHISFSIPQMSNVTISIYDINGRLIEIIYKQEIQIGDHTITWDASKYPSGTYFIKLKTEDFQYIRKCLLLR